MIKQNYKIQWMTAYNQKREKYFSSLRQLHSFRKYQLKLVQANFTYYFFNGVKWEQIAFLDSKIVKRSDFDYLKRVFN